ncbi:MAG: primosomal protein N' [Clostridia bacterium]|nr:primosomal protein N' [Clostridia bacterium]
MPLVCRVAIDQIVQKIDRDYDYLLPGSFASSVLPGMRVLVPFGNGNVLKKAMVFSVFEEENPLNLKSIVRVLDQAPMLDEQHLRLAEWMADQYFITRYQAIRCMIPRGLDFKINEIFALNPDRKEFPPEYQELVAYMQETGKAVRRSDFPAKLKKRCIPAFRDGVLIEEIRSVRNIGDLKEKKIRLAVPVDQIEIYLSELDHRYEKQRDLLSLFLDEPVLSAKDALYYSGCGPSTVKTLSQKGLIEVYHEARERIPYRSMERSEERQPIHLEEEQNLAYRGISASFDQEGVHLLHGVTGSGKTHVFMRLMDDLTAAGRSVLMLVPEIALTPQMLGKFYLRYGDCVSVLHSGLSIGEKADEWKKIHSGAAKIVVGTRSAVFAPLKNLGLIIMDEEHESTYKSETSPRFHARDIARFLSHHLHIPLLLASATPAIESYYLAERGSYRLHTLTKRYNNASLPDVQLIDMRQEITAEGSKMFSESLKTALEETLATQEQAILFLNRRGMHSVVGCSSCGAVAKCPSCGIALTYHKPNQRLMCHYCGYNIKRFYKCPECSSEHIKMLGLGTQYVEEELQAMFPSVRILRMDMDTVDSYISYGDLLSSFRSGKYDIMLGTQMVAKGLDFPAVTLVGILQADMSLYTDDFRANERTFNLLTQVCGRSGRSGRPGRAIIQTYCPEHQVISLSKDQDYLQFYRQEIAFRKLVGYPPFCDILLIVAEGFSEQAVAAGMGTIYRFLQKASNEVYKDIPLRLLSPVVPRIGMLRGRYRMQMLVKCRNSARLRQLIRDCRDLELPNGLQVLYNMNPIQYF